MNSETTFDERLRASTKRRGCLAIFRENFVGSWRPVEKAFSQHRIETCLPCTFRLPRLRRCNRAPAAAKQLGPTFRWDGQGYFPDVRIVLPARAAADRFERFAECQRRSMRARVWPADRRTLATDGVGYCRGEVLSSPRHLRWEIPPAWRKSRGCIKLAAMLRRGLIGMLLVTLLALIPLASASPPDETWFAGIYDNGDYDDVVITATSMPGWFTDVLLDGLRPLRIVIAAAVHRQPLPPKIPDLAHFPQFRAPPLGA